MLSLILQKNNWDDVLDSKRDRALNKLSKLFGVPKVCGCVKYIQDELRFLIFALIFLHVVGSCGHLLRIVLLLV